ncbi:hypothetical protein NI17_024140 (plasmid) [Thermobifida halotolerans]|uniref:Uncharacterized protein n=1 Tax=Thermobifida halotolerans TaxID=483545 RepID=A0A399FTD7_9ACTN|nr:hypothetical protein [Thermobifida halotolerans]UOE22258.1 hypothetical protein NI17_024140 [Thermobifida halotolerans]
MAEPPSLFDMPEETPREQAGTDQPSKTPADTETPDTPEEPDADRPGGQAAEDESGNGDEEPARAEAAFNRDSFAAERPSLHIEFPDEQQGDQEQRRGRAELVLGEPAQESDRSDSQTEENTSEDQEQRRVHEIPRLDAGEGPHTIDGRRLRAAHRDWQPTLERKGRAAAIQAVDPKVYEQMRRQFEAAMNADRDVRLVLPSNDPERVEEFVRMARERGYEVTLSARIPPVPQRQMSMLSQLNEHFHNRTLYHAITPDESRSEYANLKQILSNAYQEQSVDRIELYPRTGRTPAVIHQLTGEIGADGRNHNLVWSKDTHIQDEIEALERARLTPREQDHIRDETQRIADNLPEPEEVHGDYREARDHIADGVDYLRRIQGLAPLDKDRARRATVEAESTHPDEHAPDNAEAAPQPRGEDTDWHPKEPSPEHEPGPEPDSKPGREPVLTGAPAPTHTTAQSQRQALRDLPRSPANSGAQPTPGYGLQHQRRPGPRPR